MKELAAPAQIIAARWRLRASSASASMVRLPSPIGTRGTGILPTVSAKPMPTWAATEIAA